jgi:hypothetical protein
MTGWFWPASLPSSFLPSIFRGRGYLLIAAYDNE